MYNLHNMNESNYRIQQWRFLFGMTFFIEEVSEEARIVYDVWECDWVTGWWQIGPSSGTLTSSPCQYWPPLYITHCSFHIGLHSGSSQVNIWSYLNLVEYITGEDLLNTTHPYWQSLYIRHYSFNIWFHSGSSQVNICFK